MSTSDEGGLTPLTDDLEEKTFVITAAGLSTYVRQFRHAAAVGEAFGYQSHYYIAEVGSLHLCLSKVFRFDYGTSARIMTFNDISGQNAGLSLLVDEANGMQFAMVFHANHTVEAHPSGIVPGEYSLNS